MPKKKEDTSEKPLVEVHEKPVEAKKEVKAVEAPKPAPATKPVVRQRRKKAPKQLTFEQWAKQRNIKDSHKGGLRAFCKNVKKNRTLEDWDEVFKAY